MEFIKKTTGTIKANPLGAVLGAGAGFYASRKFMPGNKYAMVGGILVGLIAGAMISSAIKPKGTPTAKDAEVKK
jgi:hypothetical protein